jgi:hypothetical protein
MTTCKSPRKVLRMAYALARDALPAYAHRCSPKTFTQHQLFACLVLKCSLNLDYRGVAVLLEDCDSLRAAIELKKVPHFTTLQKAASRLLQKSRFSELLDASVRRARRARMGLRKGALVALDSSGFEAFQVSHYFVRRRAHGGNSWQNTTYRRFVKLGLLMDCFTHLILSAIPGRGPHPDFDHLVPAVEQARDRLPLSQRCSA